MSLERSIRDRPSTTYALRPTDVMGRVAEAVRLFFGMLSCTRTVRHHPGHRRRATPDHCLRSYCRATVGSRSRSVKGQPGGHGDHSACPFSANPPIRREVLRAVLGAEGSFDAIVAEKTYRSSSPNRQVIPRSWDQRQAASLGLAWYVARTSASVQLGWHSGWPQTPLTIVPGTASAPESLVVGTRNSARWGDYFSADLRLTRITPLRYGELALWVDATNITNRANHCCIDLNANSAQGTSMATTDNIWSRRAINVGFTWRLRRPR